MPHQTSLRTNLRNTLNQTRDALHELRRVVARRGHVDAMQLIDSLISVAEDETTRSIKCLDLPRPLKLRPLMK